MGLIWLWAITEVIIWNTAEQLDPYGLTDIIVRSIEPTTELRNAVAPARSSLTDGDFNELIRAIPMIRQAAPMREMRKEISHFPQRTAQGRVFGCTPSYFEVTELRMQRGRFVGDKDDAEQKRVAVLGTATASKLFPYEDPIGRSIMIERDFYVVVGVVSQKAKVDPTAGIDGSPPVRDHSDQVYIPLRTMWRQLGQEVVAHHEGGSEESRLELSEVILRIDGVGSVSRSAQLVRETLGRAHHANDYRMIVPLEVLEQARSTRLRLVIFTGCVLVILHVVGGIIATRMMLGTARHKEQTAEKNVTLRPTSVTVIGWILVVETGFLLIALPATINYPMARVLLGKSPIPVPIQYAMTYAGLLIMLVCGLAMLNKCNWARFLYVACTIVFLIEIATSSVPAATIFGFVVFATIAFLFFRPKANEYFSPVRATNNAQGD